MIYIGRGLMVLNWVDVLKSISIPPSSAVALFPAIFLRLLTYGEGVSFWRLKELKTQQRVCHLLGYLPII